MFSSSEIKQCKRCFSNFKVKAPTHLFCSRECQMKFWIENNTERYKCLKVEYRLAANGNWQRSLQNLIYSKQRRHLKIDDLLLMLKNQNYVCALSGIPLTCSIDSKEKSMTNVSIDRLDKNKDYNLDNIRLVCTVANVMRWIMNDEELYYWCENILNYRKKQK